MAIKLKTQGEFLHAIKILRHYADGFGAADGYDLRHFSGGFDIPITAARQKRIAAYYDIYQRHIGYKGASFQKFKDPKKLKSAQAAMGMPTKQSWRGVFVAEPSPNTPARLVERGKGKNKAWVVEYVEQGADMVYVPFDRVQFAMYEVAYVQNLLAGLPDSYRYMLAMGDPSRKRWKARGNLRQFLADLELLIHSNKIGDSGGGSSFEEYMTGVIIVRGGHAATEKLAREHIKTRDEKTKIQEDFRKVIRRERRKLSEWENAKRSAKKFPQLWTIAKVALEKQNRKRKK